MRVNSDAERLMVVDLGPYVRAGVYARGPGGYRILAAGSAPSTLDAPHFDLTPAFEGALADIAVRAGSYAFPGPPRDGPLADRAPDISAVTGDEAVRRPTAFLLGNLVQRDLDELTGTITQAGFEKIGAATSVRAFRERVDGPAALEVIVSRMPDTIVVALTGDDADESLDYAVDLLTLGLADHESGYLPRVVVLYGGAAPASAADRLTAALPTTIFQVYGGSPTEPMDMGTPLAALQDSARAVQRAKSADRVVPPAVSRAPQVPREAALGAAAQWLSAGQELDVAIISFDYGDVTAATARDETSVVTRLNAERAHGRPFHLGLYTPVDRVARWTADEPLPEALQVFVLERTAQPTALPSSSSELQLAHAIWTAAARETLSESGGGRGQSPSVDLAVITGDITRTLARPVQAALVLINSLETAGVTQLALDASNALVMSGSLIHAGLPAAVESSLVRLGACAALRGDASLGNAAVAVEVHPAGASVIEREVTAGSMDVIQWDADVEAEVRIWPAPEFDAGLGYGRPVHLRAPIVAGSVGLIVDARGRPLVWPDASDARQAWVAQWHRALNAYPAARPRRQDLVHVS